MSTVESLHIYPIKSLGGIAVEELHFDSRGPLLDRRYMLIDSEGQFMTQRTLPEMAKIKLQLVEKKQFLKVFCEDKNILIDLNQHYDKKINATVWKYQGPMLDCGDEAGLFFSNILKKTCRLVQIPSDCPRLSSSESDLISLVDSRQLLLASTQSLNWVNQELKKMGEVPVLMNQFRPNIIVKNVPSAFAEDDWKEVRIGDSLLKYEKMCGRCSVITVNQDKGEKGSSKVLKVLAQNHKTEDGSNAAFGVYFHHEISSGSIKIGDQITVTKKHHEHQAQLKT